MHIDHGRDTDIYIVNFKGAQIVSLDDSHSSFKVDTFVIRAVRKCHSLSSSWTRGCKSNHYIVPVKLVLLLCEQILLINLV